MRGDHGANNQGTRGDLAAARNAAREARSPGATDHQDSDGGTIEGFGMVMDSEGSGDDSAGSTPEVLPASDTDSASGGAVELSFLSVGTDENSGVAIVAIQQARNDLYEAQENIRDGYELHAAEKIEEAQIRLAAARGLLVSGEDDESVSG
jgi:hypothetical protein